MRLFDPGKIGNLRIKNRVIMSPMNVGGNNESDGCLSQRGIDYFVERAKGGTGMIVTGATRVTRKFERDKETIPLWMLFADHMVHGKWISELAERCHDYGTKICIQLTAGGEDCRCLRSDTWISNICIIHPMPLSPISSNSGDNEGGNICIHTSL